MPKDVKCKNCNRLKNHWCKAVLDSPVEDMERDCRHFIQKTNADRIRAMTDEELAWFLAERYAKATVLRLANDGYEPTAAEIKVLTEMLYITWMRWLRHPAEVDNERT